VCRWADIRPWLEARKGRASPHAARTGSEVPRVALILKSDPEDREGAGLDARWSVIEGSIGTINAINASETLEPQIQ